MKKSLKVILGVTICFTLVSCGKKSDDAQKSIDAANNSVKQLKKDTDKDADDAKKIADDANKDSVAVLDLTSSGGQPGDVSLFGALLSDEVTLDPKVSVILNAGKGWKGLRPEVKKDILTLKANLTEGFSQEQDKLKVDKTFVNMGCDLSTRTDLKDLQEQPANTDKASTAAVIKANTVLICGTNPISIKMTFITAKTVVMSGVQQSSVGALSTTMSISAGELIVDGENRFSLNGIDDSSTVFQGPSLSIGAEKFSGSGKLQILSEGSNYKVDAK